jgi:hypothetical protein
MPGPEASGVVCFGKGKSANHANGDTLGAEPGGIAVEKAQNAQNAQNAVLSDSSSPFRFYFIADGKSITGVFPDEKVGEETEKLLSWGQGHDRLPAETGRAVRRRCHLLAGEGHQRKLEGRSGWR